MILNEKWAQCRMLLVQAADYLEAIKERSIRLGLDEAFEKRLSRQQSDMDNDNITLRLLVAGKNKNGKSTLVNSLIGPSSNEAIRATNRAQMNMGYGTTTAALTEVQYGQKIEIIAKFRKSGKMEYWDESRYQMEAKADNPEIKKIERFIYKYPSELLEKNLVLIDTPGLDDTDELSRITESALEEVNAVLYVLRSDSLNRPEESRWFDQHVKKRRTFFIVNDMKGKMRTPEEYYKFQAGVWNELVTKKGIVEEFSPDKLAAKDIYIVDAKSALEGKWNDDPILTQKSGLWSLEAALAQLLQIDGEQANVFLSSWLLNTNLIIADISSSLDERMKELQNDLQAKQVQAKQGIDYLHKLNQTRPQIIGAITNSRSEALQAIKESLRSFFESFRNDYLPSLVQIQQASIWDNLKEGITDEKKDKIKKEVTNELNRKLTDWQDYVASEILVRKASELEREITPLINDIIEEERKPLTYSTGEETYKLTEYGSTVEIDPMERFLSGVGGLVGGGFFGAFAGAVYGKEGAIGVSIGSTVAVIGAGLLGVASFPVLIGATVVGGIIGLLSSGESIGERLQEKIMNDAKNAMEGFESQAEQSIVERVEGQYNGLQKRFEGAFDQRIEDNTKKLAITQTDLVQLEADNQPMIKVLIHEKNEINRIVIQLNTLPTYFENIDSH